MKTKMIVIAAMLLMCAGTTVFSQQKTTFGIRGGINFYNLTGKDADGKKLDYKLKTGFNAGVNAEIPVGIDFYLQPGVLFVTKGTDAGTNKYILSYIEVPVNFLYKPALGKGRLIMGFGPYAAFGMGGSYRDINEDKHEVKFKSDITTAEYLSGTAYFKGFDAGANLLFGYECRSKISVQLNAGLGLINISPDHNGSEYGETSLKNTGFGISAGYRF